MPATARTNDHICKNSRSNKSRGGVGVLRGAGGVGGVGGKDSRRGGKQQHLEQGSHDGCKTGGQGGIERWGDWRMTELGGGRLPPQ